MSPTARETKEIAWLEVDTPDGNFVIQPGHAPVLLILAPGKPVTCMLKSGRQEIIEASGGIVHITRTTATLLLDA